MTCTASIITDLFIECEARGIKLALADSGRVTVDAPEVALTPDLLGQLQKNKADVLDALERFEERTAILEFDAGLTRPEAERLARQECLTK